MSEILWTTSFSPFPISRGERGGVDPLTPHVDPYAQRFDFLVGHLEVHLSPELVNNRWSWWTVAIETQQSEILFRDGRLQVSQKYLALFFFSNIWEHTMFLSFICYTLIPNHRIRTETNQDYWVSTPRLRPRLLYFSTVHSPTSLPLYTHSIDSVM